MSRRLVKFTSEYVYECFKKQLDPEAPDLISGLIPWRDSYHDGITGK
jgi:hypothetical protein